MRRLELQIELESYIGHPYWPEMARLVDITKTSGMSRARSSANARKALEEYLTGSGMTLEEYEELKRRAERPFYTVADLPSSQRNGSQPDAIIVPELHVMSMLVQVCDSIRAAGRPVSPDQVRSLIRCTPWITDRSAPDGVWERFAVVSSGTGAKLSNQRGFRSNPYIGSPPSAPSAPVRAAGAITVEESMVRPEVLLKALEWGGRYIGIGASRKMGWGRFQVVRFQ